MKGSMPLPPHYSIKAKQESSRIKILASPGKCAEAQISFQPQALGANIENSLNCVVYRESRMEWKRFAYRKRHDCAEDLSEEYNLVLAIHERIMGPLRAKKTKNLLL